MNVLVVDDERTTRFLLRRILTMEYDCTVGEAGDGVEALEMLASASYDFMVLDLRMPVMGGMETLRVLRSSGQIARLPVVMLTAERDEKTVRQAFDLGVVDYLVKPLNRDRLIERLNRLVRWMEAEGPQAVPFESKTWDAGPVLVVDGDGATRAEYAAALGQRCKVFEADTGSRAVRICTDERPTMVLVGSRLGVLKPHLLVRKLRGLAGLEGVRLVKIGRDADEGEEPVEYDGVLPPGLAPEVLVAELTALSAPRPGPIGELLRRHPTLRANLASIAEQVFRVMTSTELSPDTAPRHDGETMVAAALATWSERRCGLQLLLRCSKACAATLAGLLLGIDAESVDHEDVVGGLQEVLEAVRSRLAQVLLGKGVQLEFEPDLVVGSSAGDSVPEGIVVHLSTDPGVHITLALACRPSQEGAAEPGPDEAPAA
jgi:two-component system, chemotaxis family, chemotaxis protein CheY